MKVGSSLTAEDVYHFNTSEAVALLRSIGVDIPDVPANVSIRVDGTVRLEGLESSRALRVGVQKMLDGKLAGQHS